MSPEPEGMGMVSSTTVGLGCATVGASAVVFVFFSDTVPCEASPRFSTSTKPMLAITAMPTVRPKRKDIFGGILPNSPPDVVSDIVRFD